MQTICRIEIFIEVSHGCSRTKFAYFLSFDGVLQVRLSLPTHLALFSRVLREASDRQSDISTFSDSGEHETLTVLWLFYYEVCLGHETMDETLHQILLYSIDFIGSR